MENNDNTLFFNFSSYHSIPGVNLNSNRTCPVCTGLPDNSVHLTDPVVQYFALTRLTYDRGQFCLA